MKSRTETEPTPPAPPPPAPTAEHTDDSLVQWAREWRDNHGSLPGRRVFMRELGLGQTMAARAAAATKRQLTRPARPGTDFSVDLNEMDDDEDLDRTWELFAQISRSSLKRMLDVEKKTVYFDGSAPVAICFPSDTHVGSPGTDMDRILEDQVLIRDTPRLYQCWGGDIGDNAIKHLGHVLDSHCTATAELKLIRKMVKIGGKKLIAVLGGNHGAWTKSVAGIDVLAQFFGNEDIIYSPHRILLTVMVGDIEYTVKCSHKYRFNSYLNPSHAVRQMLKQGQWDFDLGCVAHGHVACAETFFYRGTIRGAVRPGSYQVLSDYSTSGGYDYSIPTCPGAVLHNDRKHLRTFNDIRDVIPELQK